MLCRRYILLFMLEGHTRINNVSRLPWLGGIGRFARRIIRHSSNNIQLSGIQGRPIYRKFFCSSVKTIMDWINWTYSNSWALHPNLYQHSSLWRLKPQERRPPNPLLPQLTPGSCRGQIEANEGRAISVQAKMGNDYHTVFRKHQTAAEAQGPWRGLGVEEKHGNYLRLVIILAVIYELNCFQ